MGSDKKCEDWQPMDNAPAATVKNRIGQEFLTRLKENGFSSAGCDSLGILTYKINDGNIYFNWPLVGPHDLLHVTYDGVSVLLSVESSELIKQIDEIFQGRRAKLRQKKEEWEARKVLQGLLPR